jgi:hypothetical protein
MKCSLEPLHRPAFLVIAGLFLTTLIAASALALFWIDRKFYPSRSEIELIKPGMTKEQVTARLGVLYDQTKPGEYDNVDQIIQVHGRDAESVLIYRISGSRDTAWIICGPGDRVIKTWIEE